MRANRTQWAAQTWGQQPGASDQLNADEDAVVDRVVALDPKRNVGSALWWQQRLLKAKYAEAYKGDTHYVYSTDGLDRNEWFPRHSDVDADLLREHANGRMGLLTVELDHRLLISVPVIKLHGLLLWRYGLYGILLWRWFVWDFTMDAWRAISAYDSMFIDRLCVEP